MPVLTGIDVLGIQRYVFASNRLRDSVAASWLVYWATTANGALEGSEGLVLQAGGGNALLIFPSLARAQEFASRYTRCLHEQAPGLEVVLAHRTYEPNGLAQAIKHLQVDLASAKLERLPSVPQLGLSVTAACSFTGSPATGFDRQEPSRPVSSRITRWRDDKVRQRSETRWRDFLDGYEGYAFPSDLDDMGRTRGDTSQIGIVYVDGNDTGQHATEWLERCIEAEMSDSPISEQLRTWSHALDSAGRQALHTVIERVVKAAAGPIREGRKGPWLSGAVPGLDFPLNRDDEGRVILPVRPVLLGGDDLTFLCDGRIALDLAQTALEALTVEVPYLGRTTACAGVAIVPAHAPFYHAYELAAELCSSAKRRRREEEMGKHECWIDWHIGTKRPGEAIGELRHRVYRHSLHGTDLNLTCRPYRLGKSGKDRDTWLWLSRTVLGTGEGGFRCEEWRKHRNKLKELSVLVREGSRGIGTARQTWTAAGQLRWPDGLEEDHGFVDGVRTPLLDALELLDIHLPLEM
jgi:hypothetical protein